MAFHRKSTLLALTNPPIPTSTFFDMVKDGRIPKPDGYLGARTPVWSDESLEVIKRNFQNFRSPARQPRRKRAAKRTATIENTTTT